MSFLHDAHKFNCSKCCSLTVHLSLVKKLKELKLTLTFMTIQPVFVRVLNSLSFHVNGVAHFLLLHTTTKAMVWLQWEWDMSKRIVYILQEWKAETTSGDSSQCFTDRYSGSFSKVFHFLNVSKAGVCPQSCSFASLLISKLKCVTASPAYWSIDTDVGCL